MIWDVAAAKNLSETEPTSHPMVLWNGSLVKIASSSFVMPAEDLDDDNTGDVVLNLRRYAAFAAFSGKTGAVLWTSFNGPGQPVTPAYGRLGLLTPERLMVGEPLMTDLDRDGTPDLIATLILGGSSNEQKRVVAGISGRSGKRIWTYPIDETPIHVSAAYLDRAAVLVRGRESRLVAYADGLQWVGIDPETGKRSIGPIDLGVEPVVPVQHADLDGDGEAEILALGPEPGGKDRLLRALSIKNGKELSAHSLEPASDLLLKGDASSGLPLVLDADGDGRLEVLVRDAGPMAPLAGARWDDWTGPAFSPTSLRQSRARLGISRSAPSGAEDVNPLLGPWVDLDGDGVCDVLTDEVRAPGKAKYQAAGSHVAIARSGRTGRRDPEDRD